MESFNTFGNSPLATVLATIANTGTVAADNTAPVASVITAQPVAVNGAKPAADKPLGNGKRAKRQARRVLAANPVKPIIAARAAGVAAALNLAAPPVAAGKPARKGGKVLVSAASMSAKRAHYTRWLAVRDGSKPGSATHTAAIAEIEKRGAELLQLGVIPGSQRNNKEAGLKAAITKLTAQVRDALPKSDYRAKLQAKLAALNAKLADGAA